MVLWKMWDITVRAIAFTNDALVYTGAKAWSSLALPISLKKYE